jgi:hypothetical protein
VESFDLKLLTSMVGILIFRASFAAISTTQWDTLSHHSNKAVEKWHLMPSQVHPIDLPQQLANQLFLEHPSCSW